MKYYTILINSYLIHTFNSIYTSLQFEPKGMIFKSLGYSSCIHNMIIK